MSLLKRLRQMPQLLKEYHSIIQDQLDKGIFEIVPQPSAVTVPITYPIMLLSVETSRRQGYELFTMLPPSPPDLR